MSVIDKFIELEGENWDYNNLKIVRGDNDNEFTEVWEYQSQLYKDKNKIDTYDFIIRKVCHKKKESNDISHDIECRHEFIGNEKIFTKFAKSVIKEAV